MTTSIEFDAVSNVSDEHSTVGEHPAATDVQVAQAAGGQAAQNGEPVPVDVGKGTPAQGADNAQGANQPAPDAKAPAGNAPAANAAASNVPHEYHAEAGNVVKLPANVSIDNIKVDGHNLVLVQPDGSEIVIKDGALNVPTFIIGDVEVPRVALIAALESSHVDVAFGADGSISAGGNGSPGSAGGNFEQPPGGIGDGFGLTSLLPPTALQFGQPENRELFPSIIDRQVSVVATSLLTPDEAASETGLDGGPSQSPGSDAPSDAETSSIGTITIDAPDGIGSIVINGDTVTGVGQQIQGQFGYITIVSFDPITGAIEYNYTVTESVTHPEQTNGFDPNDTVPDNFSITVTDSDGDTASATFAVAIIDDVPTAVADTDSIAAGQFGPATGNVLVGGTDGADANTTDGVADTKGADGATVVGVAAGDTNADSSGSLGVQVQGTYGKLTLAADGTYSYVRDAGTPGGVNDVFTYTIKDGDGDTSHTTLTISIGDSTPTISIPVAGGADTTVYEAGLPARGGEPQGSNEPAASETTSGTIGFTSPDGLTTVSLGGHALSGVAQTFTDATGSLTASYVYNATTGVGTISYSYTLIDNTSGDNTSASFAVVVTDADGDPAPAGNLVINIIDDVPTAHADTDSVAANQFTAEAGNVLTAVGTTSPVTGIDVLGADGATVAGVAKGDTNANLDSGATVNAPIHGTYGTLTLQTDGSYSYTRDAGSPGGVSDVFTYTIKDGDGDLSHTTLTISIGDSTPTDTIPAPGGADTTVYEAGLPARGGESAGSNAAANSETTSGSIGFTSPDGIQTVSLGGHVLTGSNQTFTDATGSLTASYSYNPATGVGTISYSYTLVDNTSGDNTSTSFAVVVTDADGDSAPAGNLIINIVDDVPTAHADTNNVAEGGI
ncbi:VCBS domain-containing protein, partial [Mesorhizobium sp.]|uniref:beta strand repeat-containing protein n=1 Tax=Mesorhizobium sp. TaxID=1871066 RepID=UPI0025CE3319